MLTSPPSYNLKLISPHQTPGSGIALAIQLNPPGTPLPQQLAMLQANAAAGLPAPPPVALGQAPPFYNADIDAYRHGDILRLIEFYNSPVQSRRFSNDPGHASDTIPSSH
jgi:hypothetical protein